MSDNTLDGLRVLVLEDEFLIAMDVEQICRDHGAGAVSIARSTEEASRLDAGSFDVAIIDVAVGGNSAVDFAKRLRAKRVPFVFASGYNKSDGVFDDFPDVEVVDKPYAGKALMSALSAAMLRLS